MIGKSSTNRRGVDAEWTAGRREMTARSPRSGGRIGAVSRACRRVAFPGRCRRPFAPSAILAAVLLAATAAAGSGGTDDAGRLLARVNAVRAAAGVPPVAIAGRLSLAARSHTEDLARRGVLSHEGGDGARLAGRLARAGYPFRLAAENLAQGVATPGEAVELWLASPGHRRNLLLPEVREIGVGHARRRPPPPGVATGDFWVLVLARRR